MEKELSNIFSPNSSNKELKITWFSAVRLYARQRFPLLLFGSLAVFLFLFAKGNLILKKTYFLPFVLLMALLFLFRIFDDLQNREYDKTKPNRSYTETGHYVVLKAFLTGYSLLIFMVLFAINPMAGGLLSGFFILNILLYKILLPHWKFRHILSLLKYPFLSFWLLFLFNQNQFPALQEVVFCLTLFPAFVLYETFTDREFPLNKITKAVVFSAIFLPFIPGFMLSINSLFWAAYIVVLLVLLLFFRIRFLPYLLLLSVLFTRLIFTL